MPVPALPPVIALLRRSVDLAFLKPAFEAACPGVGLRLRVRHQPLVTVTPHIATRATPQGIAAQTLQNLAAVRAGRPAALAVDLSLGD